MLLGVDLILFLLSIYITANCYCEKIREIDPNVLKIGTIKILSKCICI